MGRSIAVATSAFFADSADPQRAALLQIIEYKGLGLLCDLERSLLDALKRGLVDRPRAAGMNSQLCPFKANNALRDLMKGSTANSSAAWRNTLLQCLARMQEKPEDFSGRIVTVFAKAEVTAGDKQNARHGGNSPLDSYSYFKTRRKLRAVFTQAGLLRAADLAKAVCQYMTAEAITVPGLAGVRAVPNIAKVEQAMGLLLNDRPPGSYALLRQEIEHVFERMQRVPETIPRSKGETTRQMNSRQNITRTAMRAARPAAMGASAGTAGASVPA